MLNTAIMALVVMTGVGVVFGFILAFANKKFSIEVNPLIHIVEDILPKGQCGACGYAGCQAYAEAVVVDPNVAPNLCVPGKAVVSNAIAELTGKAAPEIAPRVAFVKCNGSHSNAQRKYKYKGVMDCVAANLLQGGPKACEHGCIGLGTCSRNCPFDALHMNDAGLPVVDMNKCTGCGKCETVCPKHVMAMVPIGSKVNVNCNSKDKGAVSRKVCSVSCLGCGICGRNCAHGAIKIENNLAVVDSSICMTVCTEVTCLAKCPTKAIGIALKDVKIEKETKEEIASN